MEYEHAGIKIKFNENRGEFSATVKGKHTVKASLPAMKTHIDKSIADAIQPYTALIRASWSAKGDVAGGDLRRVTVVGLRKKKRGEGSSGRWNKLEYCYELADGTIQESVMDDTEENVERWLACKAHKAETERIEKERHEEYDVLDEAVVWTTADAHAKKDSK